MDIARVVIGVDFSGVMTRAAPWVRTNFAPTAAVTLVHAAEWPEIPTFLRALVPSGEARHARELREAAARLCEWQASVGMPDAHIVVREGRADDVLRHVARETASELVVVGAHGGRERPWARLGTTAERLLRAAESSLLIVRGKMGASPKRILVAIDDATITPRVLATAGALADRFDAHLHAVHVLSNSAYSHVASIEAAQSRSDDEAREKVEADMADEAFRWLTALWQNTTKHGKLEIDVPHGVPGDEILRIAKEFDADLIVIGRYGIGRMLPAFLGSVVGSVVQGADCPVLVVSDP